LPFLRLHFFQQLSDLGYVFDDKILNSKIHGNIPQSRERIFIVGFTSKEQLNAFEWPDTIKLTKSVADIVEPAVQSEFYYNRFSIYNQLKTEIKRKNIIYQWRRAYVRENKSNVCPTLTANMGTGGHNVPLILDDKDIRKLTPRECARFQGYPEKYIFPEDIAKAHLYKQIGNSVVVPLIERLANSIVQVLA